MHNRRTFIKASLALGAAGFAGPTFASDKTYQMVRIDGLAEQAVGAEMLKEIYNRAGLSVEITAMPGKRALQEASSGAKDGETLRIFALGENESRLKRVPTAISSLRTAVFSKSNSGISIASVDDLNAYKGVVVAGVLHTEAASKDMPDVSAVKDSEQMFKMLSAGRAEIALSGYLDGLSKLRQFGLDDIEVMEPPLRVLELYHYLHESNEDLVPVIDAVVSEMAASGELAALREQKEADYLASF